MGDTGVDVFHLSPTAGSSLKTSHFQQQLDLEINATIVKSDSLKANR